ncbi:hypothetical protein [Pseudogemmobacter humi]|uniref:hypothetical protein n=1 Tax=Pseudogemmobacter humi TaxID=2483812 RepID=UPI0018EF8EB2|nr:hypothetical protein [Pseudogemmobacter humi]
MLWKIIILFLCAMALVAMIGKLVFPGKARRKATCRACGRPLIGRGPCACGKGKA